MKLEATYTGPSGRDKSFDGEPLKGFEQRNGTILLGSKDSVVCGIDKNKQTKGRVIR